LYILLTGYLPFGGNNAGECFKNILSGKVDYSQEEWKKVSKDAMDLVKKLLCVDVKKRLTANKALNHHWFKILDKSSSSSSLENRTLDPNVLSTLKSFKGVSKLKHAALNVLVKTLNHKEIEHLRDQFS
jgi:serine/threonine protein kinase